MTLNSFELTTPNGDAVRNKYRNEGRSAERDYLIEQIERQVCFDALADHKSLETFRHAHPEIVGHCAHHGGKCSDLLTLIHNLKMGNK